MKTKIVVRTSFIGWHYWKDAPIEVQFLRALHRHVFHVQVTIPVTHSNRDLEFFIVQSFLNGFIKKLFPDGMLQQRSCEMIAEEILKGVMREYGINKGLECSVFEDNENGAIVFSRKDQGIE